MRTIFTGRTSKFYIWSIEKELDGAKKYLGSTGKSMKIPTYIRRKRSLEGLGDSLLLRRLTHQGRILNHGLHDSLYLFAKRLISRYETFRQLILSRREARNKTRTTLQFAFRLPFYIQNIDNKSSVQPAIYSSSKNLYILKKSTISYVAFGPSKNTFLLNKNGYINKYVTINKILISKSNTKINSILTNNIVSNTNVLYDVHDFKNKSLYHQEFQYKFDFSENLANVHILIPNESIETSRPKILRYSRYTSKYLKMTDSNTDVLNIKNYHADTQIKKNYHYNAHIKMLKSHLEKNLEKIFKTQINYLPPGSGYTNLSNIIHQYRFDDHTTPADRQRHRFLQNAPYRSPIRPYSLSQILSAQQILRLHINQSVPAQTESRNRLGRSSHVVHAHTLYPAFSAPQPSEQVTRKRQILQYTEPEITHKRQIGMQQKSREEQGDVQNVPAVSLNRTAKPLGIAELPQTYRPFNIDDLANQVMQKMADKLKTEQERRGIFV